MIFFQTRRNFYWSIISASDYLILQILRPKLFVLQAFVNLSRLATWHNSGGGGGQQFKFRWRWVTRSPELSETRFALVSLLCKKTSKTSPLNWQTTNYIVTNHVNNHGLKNNTINWRDYNSFWLWRWRLHRSSKRRSLSTTVLFRTTLTWTMMFHLQYEMIPGFKPFTRFLS